MHRKIPLLILAAILILNGCASTYEITISIEPLGTGTVSGEGSFSAAETVSVEVEPEPGFQFLHWTEDGEVVSEDKVYRFEIQSHRNLTAVFAVKEYAIRAEANDQELGIVSGDGSFRHGEAVTLTAEPNEFSVFKGWWEGRNLVSTEKGYKFTADGDRELAAEFALEEGLAKLNVSAQDTQGSVTGAGIYDAGQKVTVAAQPREGYWFDCWTEDGEIVSYNQEYEVILDTDRSLTANFVNTQQEFQETRTVWQTEVAPFDETLIINGKLLALSREAMSCLDLKTGKTLWSKDYSREGLDIYWEDTVWSICYRVYTDKTFTYTLVDDSWVYIEQVDLTTGKVRWRTQLAMESQGRSLSMGQEDEGQDLRLLEQAGLLWVNRSMLDFWYLDLTSGKEVKFLADKYVIPSGEYYFTSTKAEPLTLAKYSTDGTLVWQRELEGKADSKTINAVSGNVVLCTTSADRINYRTLALDKQTGEVLWNQEGFPGGIHQGKAFVATTNKLSLVDIESGEIANKLDSNFATDQGWVLNFIVGDDVAYFKDNDTFRAFEYISGKTLWTKEILGLQIYGRLAEDMTGNPLLSNSQVLWMLADEDYSKEGTLLAIDRKSGDISANLPFPTHTFMWGNKDEYIFADKSGKPLVAVFDRVDNPEVEMLDGLTGKTLWSYVYKERARMLNGGGDYVALCSGNEIVFLTARTGKLAANFRVIGTPLHLAGNNLLVAKNAMVSLVQPVE